MKLTNNPKILSSYHPINPMNPKILIIILILGLKKAFPIFAV